MKRSHERTPRSMSEGQWQTGYGFHEQDRFTEFGHRALNKFCLWGLAVIVLLVVLGKL